MVTKRERLDAALAGDVADRPPVALWRHFPVDDQDPVALAKATALFQKRYDFDFIKVSPASSFCLKDWGVDDAWRGNTEGTRDYTQRVVHEAGDWKTLSALNPTDGSLGNQLHCLKLLREEVGAEVPIIQTVFSPLAQAKNLAGKERLLEHIHRSPEDVLTGLGVITRSTIAFTEQAKDCGVDGVFYAIQHGSYAYFDRDGYARFGEPFDLRVLESVSDLRLNVLHLHGEALMFDLAARLPVQVVNWHDRETWPTLKEGKAMIEAAVCGGIRRETVVLGSPARVREEAESALQSVDRRGMILGTGCVVPILAPHGNLMAARAAVDFA
jgi:uroporphyrinogen decarboxylase